MAAQYSPRLCIGEGCGVDISHRKHNCIRCEDCQFLHAKFFKKDWRLHGIQRPKVIKPVKLCPCGVEIASHRKDSVRGRVCQRAHERQMSRVNPSRKARDESHKRTTAHVNPGHNLPTDPEYTPTIHCKECCGLPHRRPHKWLCPKCREHWAPEARPEQIVYRSSAGTAAGAGRLYGCDARITKRQGGVDNGMGRHFFRKGVK